MRTRIGIELTPVACRIVEVADHGRAWRNQRRDSIVRSFGVWPATGADTDAALAALRGRLASVVVWGTASEHRQVEVRPGSYEAMRAEALRTLADAGVPVRGAWADIAPGGPADGAHRTVVVALAAAPAMAAAVQPLIDAGIRVRTVITPAAALAAIARSRRATSVPDALEAYVALEETAACVAFMRVGALMAARDLPWGFLDEHGNGREPRRREDIAARLGDDLAELFIAHEDAGRVSQVCICGGLPELRSTTLPLMERLDVEAETLDSLFGIDAGSLPEPAHEFRERASELRLAWVAAAEWTTINLLRAQRRRTSHAALSRAAVVAGVAAGLGGSWSVARIDSWTTPALIPVTRTAVNVVPPSPSPLAPGPLAVMEESRPAMQQPSPVVQQLPRIAQEPPPAVQGPPRIVQEPPLIGQPPPIRQEPPPIGRVQPSAIAVAPPAIRSEPPPIRRAPTVIARISRAAPVRTARSRMFDEAPPFEAVLSSILFSADRQLAIVDGRVVGRGDDVRGATVVEISAGAVIVRDSQGRLRRLASGRSDR